MGDMRRKYTGSDLDLVLKGELEIEKFCATRNVTPRTAFVWCLERAKSQEEEKRVRQWMKDYFNKGIGLL